MSEITDCKVQNVVLKDRHEIRISGVVSVDSFDEFRICATCNDGVSVVVDGYQLTIKEVNLENCYIEAVGEVQGFFYDEKNKSVKNGFFKSLFIRK